MTLNSQGQEQSQEKGRLSLLSGLAIGKRPAMLVVAQLSPPLQGLGKALGNGPGDQSGHRLSPS